MSSLASKLSKSFKSDCWPCLLSRGKAFASHEHDFKPRQISKHLHIGRSPRNATGIRDLFQWPAPIDRTRLIYCGQVNRMLTKQLNDFNCLATLCVSCTKTTLRKHCTRFHVFTQNLHRSSIAREEVSANPVSASYKLPYVGCFAQSSKTCDRIGLLRHVGRSFTINMVSQQVSFLDDH